MFRAGIAGVVGVVASYACGPREPPPEDPSALPRPTSAPVGASGTACGDVRCSGKRAGCRYERSKRHGECVPLDQNGDWPESVMSSLGDDTALLRCASPKDCPGKRCCTGGPLPMTECTEECMSGIDVCDTVADCPVFIGAPTGCDADPAGPSFLKTCRYRTP
jgi:hypothetical protein